MDIAIIGGGASGMILASMLDKKYGNVTIYEKNTKLGKKLLLTGNGKCNFTSGDFDNLKYIYNNDFAINLYNKYNNEKCLEFYKSLGIEPKLEIHKGKKYYYPKSNKSTSVYYNLLDKITTNGINIKCDCDIKSVDKKDSKYVITSNDGKKYTSDRIVFATGGLSYKKTGSDGEALNILKKFGHKIVKPIPGLTGLITSDKDISELKGVRVDCTIYNEKYDIEESGEVQFTEYGISGIPVFNISNKINRFIDSGEKIILNIDFEVTESDIKIRAKNLYYKKVRDFLCGLIPDELSLTILKRIKIDTNKSVKSLNETELKNIYNILSKFEISISSYQSFDNAQVTIGGVDVTDIDIETMESKKSPGLYIIGEALDIDGICGGYNLQLCYSTACAVCRGLSCNQN